MLSRLRHALSSIDVTFQTQILLRQGMFHGLCTIGKAHRCFSSRMRQCLRLVGYGFSLFKKAFASLALALVLGNMPGLGYADDITPPAVQTPITPVSHTLEAAPLSDAVDAPIPQAIDDRPMKNGQPGLPPGVSTWQPKQLDPAAVATYLGWVDANVPNQICHGYYLEPNLYYAQAQAAQNNKGPVHISADQTAFSQTGTSVLVGSVQVNQPNQQITAEKAYLNRDATTQKINSIDVYGHVVVREPGTMAMGDQGHFDLTDKSLYLNDVLYRTSFGPLTPPNTSAPLPLDAPVVVNNLNGWGMADQMNRDSNGIIHVLKGTYTACPPKTSFWRLAASKLTLNRETGRGVARNGVLYLKEFPILYSPYFSFPIDNRRQTGFLYPTFGHSSRSGYDIGVPFYWNIAPNYDATITPDYLSLRGLQMNGLFRYLTPSSTGNFHGSFLPNDNAYAQFKKDQQDKFAPSTPGLNSLENSSDNRYFVSFLDDRKYNDNWSSHLYVNHASDDYYFEDFDGDAAQTSENQIINEADLNFNDVHWNFTGQLQGYQTLHPINQGVVANQYEKLPELKLNGNYPGFLGDLNFSIANQFDNFQIQKNPWQSAKGVYGDRLYTDPTLSLPKYWLWGFIKPEVQLTATQYDLRNQLSNQQISAISNPISNPIPNQVPNQRSSIDRVLPIIDVDSGLYFDKNMHIGQTDYTQTLEPRVFYLYVPYQNQNDIPLFDTSIEPFSYTQLFQTNRYNGIDRIGDTNQISLALTSRLLNQTTGEEILRASVGQIEYFENRRVNLNANQLDLVSYDNQVPPDAATSPIAGELEYHITHDWLALGDVAWEPSNNQLNNADFALQYHHDDNHIINFGYHFLRGGDALTQNDNGVLVTEQGSRSNLNQTDISAVWPLSEQWKLVGRWNYNVSHNYPQTYYGGVEYEACCWAFRVVVGRDFDYLNEKNKPVFDQQVYFQIALKTLGNVGTNDPSGMFTRDIPGYRDHFGTVSAF